MLYSAFYICMYIFFIILSLNLRVLWMNIAFVTVFTAAIGASLYLTYHYKHSKKEEKQRMISQKPLNHYYYDRWYTPADSTQLENEVEKVKKRKNSL